MTTTINRINELELVVNAAQTPTSQGRQIVARSCKELYELIEDELYIKFGSDAIIDAESDLCKGDFSEPFMCEKKKETFNLYKTIFLKITLN